MAKKLLHSRKRSNRCHGSESIGVLLGESGAPVQLDWQGQSYQVVAPPVLWVDRTRWWESGVGFDTAAQDFPVWRLNVTPSPPVVESALAAIPAATNVVDIARTASQEWQLHCSEFNSHREPC